MSNLLSVIADIQVASRLLSTSGDDPAALEAAMTVLNHASGDLDLQVQALHDEMEEQGDRD